MIKTQAGQTVGDTGSVQRIYRRTQLPAVTGYSIQYIYELMAADKFPKPIKLGARAVGWLESDLAKWQRKRIALRDGTAAE